MYTDYNPEIVGNRTYSALKALFNNSRDLQKDERIANLRCRDQLSFMKEFCTIKMQSTRRSGHSTAIAKLINEEQRNWAVIAPTLTMNRRIYELTFKYNSNIKKATLDCINFENNKTVRFLSLNTLDNRLRGFEFEGIIVDCAFMLSNKQIEKLYKLGETSMRFSREQYFIFVG